MDSMKKTVIGIAAHVDAGKTTLAEAMLYRTGAIRKAGRVDTGDTLLDFHEIEKSRGITVFASQAAFRFKDRDITILDTPGHVDFSAETERVLQVIDCAILVINACDGVQSHTVTLWNLLKSFNVPTVIFITKTDLERRTKEDIMTELCRELSDTCIDFSSNNLQRDDSVAMCSEDVLNEFLSKGSISNRKIRELVGGRLVFPCFFGSGLKMTGIDAFLRGLCDVLPDKTYPAEFGGRIFKVTYDKTGGKTAYLKVTGGVLKVKDMVKIAETEEKINEIRIYSGNKYNVAEKAEAGDLCAVTGLSKAESGMGLGFEADAAPPILEPMMSYRVVFPENTDPRVFLPKLRMIEEEEPSLHVSHNPITGDIHVTLMGEVQAEILKSLISERFQTDVEITNGHVLYKETIVDTVEGVGHYEPLRHYAEVHLIMTPGERGSGLVFESKCKEDVLSRNWQRLILEHLKEKQHIGVLTGAPITDIKITLVAGRAHLKHTEGGDFRQATYRAVRQGLMQANSMLLEPYYSFRLEVPLDQIGRAISDIKMRSGEFDAPCQTEETAILTGRAPVECLNDYATEVASYTSGKGKLRLVFTGYDKCHNSEEVVKKCRYNPESDTDNSPDSVFCAHGSGFTVKWNKVSEYMHIDSCLKKEKSPYDVTLNSRNFYIDDKELEAIMEKEFGPERTTQTLYRSVVRGEDEHNVLNFEARKKCVIVDGYNCIFSWEELKSLAEDNMDGARERLADILCNYSVFTGTEIVLVFDGYMVQGNRGETLNYHNIHVVYTKEHETGDVYIEKLISQIGKNYNVRIVTSDAMIQLTAARHGVIRVPSQEFEREIEDVRQQINLLLQGEK